LTLYLNTNDLCSEDHYGSKSTRGKLENWFAIVGSDAKYWDIVAILGEQLGANLVQGRKGKKGTITLHILWKERQ
jgi:hypothetical protein